jgi:hypothetical protein
MVIDLQVAASRQKDTRNQYVLDLVSIFVNKITA